MNRFIKLLMLETADGNFILLYGFSVDTNQPPYLWRRRRISKTRQVIYTTIMTKTKATVFEERLTQKRIVPIGTSAFISPMLTKRDPVLSQHSWMSTNSAPITKCGYVTEFWNTDKLGIRQQVENTLGGNGKQLLLAIQDLLDWMHSESGIDFFQDGSHFGNFEHFLPLCRANDFEVDTQKKFGLKQTCVYRKFQTEETFIVNCISEHRGRPLANEVKIFPPDTDILCFFASEPMSRTIVQVWNMQNGTLVFINDQALIMSIHIHTSFGGAAMYIRDPWTQKLHQSACNHEQLIQQIERVENSISNHPTVINSDTRNDMDAAFNVGRSLFLPYRHKRPKGSFIPPVTAKGEVDCLQKIRELIEASGVEKVILADPYFSVISAEKLLTRIRPRSPQLEIITSLTGLNPDTGASTDAAKECQAFLVRNQALIHPNLVVYNLQRGNSPVFHDRCLIRFFENGEIDGFLLSNSINSMGQLYPFIIAPMEKEVCLDVCEYFDGLMDASVQQKLPKKSRISCEVIFDGTKKPSRAISHESTIETTQYATYLAPWLDSWGKLLVSSDQVPHMIAEVWRHWGENPSMVCQCLGNAVMHTTDWKLSDIIAHTMLNENKVSDQFIQEFLKIAKERERAEDHLAKGVDSEQFQTKALLSGEGTPSQGGFHHLMENCVYISYRDASWLRGGYILLLKLDLNAYMDLLEATHSPLMFSVLQREMFWFSYRKPFVRLSQSDNLCLRLTAAEWLFSEYNNNKLDGQEVQKFFQDLPPHKRALQCAYSLGRVAFHHRMGYLPATPQGGELGSFLENCLAADLDAISEAERSIALHWLYDCESCSHCKLHLSIAARTRNKDVKILLLQNATEIAKRDLLDHANNIKHMDEIRTLYLDAVEQLHGDDSEAAILSDFGQTRIFEQATEPAMRNYDYTRWHTNYLLAKQQFAILQMYYQRHPDKTRIKEILDMWTPRIEVVDKSEP